MYKKVLGMCLCFLLTGCSAIDTMRSNAEDVLSKIAESTDAGELTLGESTTTISDAPDNADLGCEKTIIGISGTKYGINADITDVMYSSEPNKLSFKLVIGDKFSIAESLEFKKVENKVVSTDEAGDAPIKKFVVTCEQEITPNTLTESQQIWDYLDKSVYDDVEFIEDHGVFIGTLQNPIILADAPIDTYIKCKSYCEALHRDLLEAIEDSRCTVDGTTGILYHKIGGNEFNLTKYRYKVGKGEQVQIEIQDIPEGFTAEDISFISDKVGYATVAKDGTISGRSNGSATITVSLKGAAVYRTVYVTVY